MSLKIFPAEIEQETFARRKSSGRFQRGIALQECLRALNSPGEQGGSRKSQAGAKQITTGDGRHLDLVRNSTAMSQRGGVSSRECTRVGTSHYKASVVQAVMWRDYCVGTAAFGCPSAEGRLVFGRTTTMTAVPLVLRSPSSQH